MTKGTLMLNGIDYSNAGGGQPYDDTKIKEEIAAKQDKIDGKSLSTNDYDNASKAKVDAIPANPKYTDTIYDDTTIKADIASNKSSITSEITRATSKEMVLSSRMDTFTRLEEGSTTGDAELIDARIGADGTTYSNVGGAIRGQVTTLKEDLTQLSESVDGIDNNLLLNNYLDSGLFIKADGMYVVTSTKLISTNANTKSIYFRCKKNTKYTIRKMKSTRFVCAWVNTIPKSGVKLFGMIENGAGDKIEIETGKDAEYIFVFYFNSSSDTTNYKSLLNSIKVYENPKKKAERCVSKAVTDAINGSNTFQCPDQFKDGSTVKVYANGLLVNPDEYTLFKQGKVKFKQNVSYTENDVFFEYDRYTKELERFDNDLSDKSHLDGLDITIEQGYTATDLYSFVADPAGGDKKVLKLHCSSLVQTDDRFRIQFNNNYYATEIEQKLSIYVPSNVASSLMSYPEDFTWFGIGGIWIPFGPNKGATSNLYSGCALSLDFCKNANDTALHYYLRTSRRSLSASGVEESTKLMSYKSSFDVKTDEWIEITLNAKVGNPGKASLTVRDSDGTHEITKWDARINGVYMGVPDPENESTRYPIKFIGNDNLPYRLFEDVKPFMIYTDQSIAKHIIDTVGEVAIYFKDYSLSGRAVNTF